MVTAKQRRAGKRLARAAKACKGKKKAAFRKCVKNKLK